MKEIKIILKKDTNKTKSFHALTPARILILGFAGLILLGTLLLSLPAASETGFKDPVLDALFTATSAVCVTGLVVVDTGNHFTPFGEMVILCLIQIGGLGFMTFATLFAILLGRKISLKERILLQEAYNQLSLEGIVRLVKYILIFSFTIQSAGALILFLRWLPDMGWQKALYYGVFHSVSAFNNAGFDLFGSFSSITAYKTDPVVNLTMMFLIILGGLGFAVLSDIYVKRGRKLSLHSRLVLQTTLALILLGTIIIFLFEMNNPKTLGNLNPMYKILGSLFQAVTPRTAGFNTLNIPDLNPSTLFFIMSLMFIGASPGSTGGGIKTTTFVCILLSVWSTIRGRTEVSIKERTLPRDIIKKSLAITALSAVWIFVVICFLLVTENKDFIQIVFESVSAFATVGLSMGITPYLSNFGKIIIIISMFLGRVGLLTAALAIGQQINKALALSQLKYPDERIIIG